MRFGKESGKELDKLVAEILGQKRTGDCPLDDNCPGKYEPQLGPWPCLPPYSTNISAAMVALEWLEQNHPWGQNIFLCLCRGGVRREHQSVRINQTGEWEEIIAHREIIGESYAHAICLAVLLARVETGF